MAITFPRVPTVAAGEVFDSAQLVALANGINARLTSGLCEPWRIAYYFYSCLSQIRNPDGYLWPARGEFLEFYQSIAPTDATWPETGPGDPAGVNVASIMPAFVFGVEAADLDSESIRLSDPGAGGVPLIPQATTAAKGTAQYYWQLAKEQRGGYDPATGLLNSPSFTAARSQFRIVTAATSPHGKSYGGYAPTPADLGPCGDATSTNVGTRSYAYFFTATAAGIAAGYATKTYTGSCLDPYGPSTDVAFVYRYPWAFVVVLNSGAVDYLDRRYYIEGPYASGARLMKHDGEFPSRVLNHFASQFRGTEAQRLTSSVRKVGFWTQGFFTSQYLLAPALGVQTDPETVAVEYPVYEFTGATNVPSNQALHNRATGATTHYVAAGFVVPAVLFGAEKLAEAATIVIFAAGVEVGRVTLTPDAGGHAEDVLVLDAPATGALTFKVESGARLTSSSGGLLVELAELLDYLPQHHDWTLVLRLAGARTVPTDGTDGSGLTEESAKTLGDNYFRWGAIINRDDAVQLYEGLGEINTNAVMESARQLSKRVRLLNRFQLTAYAVEGGKSCLWFNRFAYGYGLGAYQSGGTAPPSNEVPTGEISADTIYIVGGAGASSSIDYNAVTYTDGQTFTGLAAVTGYTVNFAGSKVFLSAPITLPPSLSTPVAGDIFDDLGPELTPIASGSLVWGRTYKVTTGGVGYAGAYYPAGTTFTAGRDDLNYTGNGLVYESNGIRASAEPTGESREWVMGLQLKAYRANESSIWKPGAYSDYFAFSERCQFYPDYNATTLPADLRWQFAQGEKIWLAPEAPTSYRYAKAGGYATNGAATADFYSSCRLYEPCLQVEKTETVAGEGNTTLVKVTLSGRLHCTPAALAAGDISSDYTTWNLANLDAEAYRTDENGIRDYIASEHAHTPTWKLGDQAKNSVVQTYPDKPTATCYPSFYFVKLLEKPYEDDNDSPSDADSPLRSDALSTAELYLRLMCEGCVDGRTTEEMGCTLGYESVFDYTWPNACFDANGLAWVPALAATPTTRIPAADARTDAPSGYGVVPATLCAAEQFNWLARICNLLTRFRVMVPYQFETDVGTTNTGLPVTFNGYNAADGSALSCTTIGSLRGYGSATPGDVATGADVGYSAATFCQSTAGARPDLTVCPGGGAWYLNAFRRDQKWRWSLLDVNAANAFQPAWSDMLATNGELLTKYTVTTETPKSSIVLLADGTVCNSAGAWLTVNGGVYAWKYSTEVVDVTTCRFVAATGTLHTAVGPAGVFVIAKNVAGPTDCCTASNASLYFAPIDQDAIILNVPLA